jgi:lipopolysaccharide export system protein LptC
MIKPTPVDREMNTAAPSEEFEIDQGRNWQINRRYSVFIRLLRKSFVFIALLLIAIVVIWLIFFNAEQQQKPAEPTQAQGETALIEARYDGVDKQNRSYRVTADRAVRSSRNVNLVNMQQPMADIFSSDNSWLALSADKGDFDQETEILNLQQNVKLFYDQGMEFSLASARIDLKNSSVVSDQPLEGHGPSGRIQASGMNLQNAGQTIIFTGPATLRLRPQSKEQPE